MPDISGGSDLASATARQPQPNCLVCGLTMISGEIVIFDHGKLVHVDCHWTARCHGGPPMAQGMPHIITALPVD